MAKSPLTGAHKSFERHGLPLIVAAFCFIVMWSDLVHSPSIDETAHLPAGISHWQLGHFDLYAVNPPLVRMVATMPVLVLPKVTDWSGYSNIAAERSEFPIGRQFVANNRGWSMCLYSIARIWLIPVYILGVVLCRTWATETTSATCGAIAARLYCCSTTVIANGGMLTPDLSSAVAGGWALWFVRSWLRSRDWLLASCIGFLLGIALLTKFPARASPATRR